MHSHTFFVCSSLSCVIFATTAVIACVIAPDHNVDAANTPTSTCLHVARLTVVVVVVGVGAVRDVAVDTLVATAAAVVDVIAASLDSTCVTMCRACIMSVAHTHTCDAHTSLLGVCARLFFALSPVVVGDALLDMTLNVLSDVTLVASLGDVADSVSVRSRDVVRAAT
jgi:hypothetical protein